MRCAKAALWPHGCESGWAMADPGPALVVALERGLTPADLDTERKIARLIRQIAPPDPAHLPLDEALAAQMRQALAAGRRVILIGDLPPPVLSALTSRIGAPGAKVLAAPPGARRLAALRALIGAAPFAFAGPDPALRAAAATVLPPAPSPPALPLRALRPHHWIKNLLVLLPLIAAHRWGEPTLWLHALLALMAFCLCSSAVYLLNDLIDLPDDRAHPDKRHRPLAAGQLSPRFALTAVAVLLVLSALLAALAGALAEIVLYALAALAYSLWLKTRVLVDLFWLVGLYLLRVLAGGAATGITTSDWLLALSGLVFASLACAKRGAELTGVAAGTLPLPHRRGYLPEDRALLTAAGLAAAFATQIVLLLYLQESRAAALYAHPGWLMVGGAVILGWLMRIWLLVGRGAMGADPIVFALHDRASLAACAALIVSFLLAAG